MTHRGEGVLRRVPRRAVRPVFQDNALFQQCITDRIGGEGIKFIDKFLFSDTIMVMKLIISHLRMKRGNVLFLILIAVALFAALSYAVTKSSSGGGNNISDEKAELQASTLIQYASNVSTAIMRTRLSGGYEWSELEYAGNNTDCPDNSDCEIFSSYGAGQVAETPKISQFDPNSANIYIRFIKIDGVGSDLPEIAMLISGIALKTCQKVNKLMGIAGPSTEAAIPYGEATIQAGDGTSSINLNYTQSELEGVSDTSSPKFVVYRVGNTANNNHVYGKKTFCICVDSSCTIGGGDAWARRFWHVLVER